jgi:UDP-N-acetylmuramate dehydrogenase
VTIQENISLAKYTTLGVGGAARWFVEADGDEEILAAVRFARGQGVEHFLLGGGSNLLVSDDGFAGLVIRMANSGLAWVDEGDGFACILAGAGTEWDKVVQLAVENNCAGIECLAGIPGSVGASPVQNIGAYGQEVSHSILSLRALDLETEKVVDISASECGFGYRRSLFNSTHKGRYAITRVVYSLKIGGSPWLEYRDVKQYFAERGGAQPSLAEVAAAVREIRARKGMLYAEDDLDSHSAGSFFKNPVVRADAVAGLAALAGCRAEEVPQYPAGDAAMVKLSAAWLIERSGFTKGFAMGRAALSSMHVLAIVNRGGATAAEIVALRDAVLDGVQAKTGIRLEQEPVSLGFAPLS